MCSLLRLDQRTSSLCLYESRSREMASQSASQPASQRPCCSHGTSGWILRESLATLSHCNPTTLWVVLCNELVETRYLSSSTAIKMTLAIGNHAIQGCVDGYRWIVGPTSAPTYYY